MNEKTRLFHTLVVVGAAITGGTIATVATVTIGAIVAGCGQSGPTNDMQYVTIDMGFPPPDLTELHD